MDEVITKEDEKIAEEYVANNSNCRHSVGMKYVFDNRSHHQLEEKKMFLAGMAYAKKELK